MISAGSKDEVTTRVACHNELAETTSIVFAVLTAIFAVMVYGLRHVQQERATGLATIAPGVSRALLRGRSCWSIPLIAVDDPFTNSGVHAMAQSAGSRRMTAQAR
jgi:hypothetical protein